MWRRDDALCRNGIREVARLLRRKSLSRRRRRAQYGRGAQWHDNVQRRCCIGERRCYKTSKTKGILDFINDPTSSTVEPKTASFPELNGEKRPTGFDSDEDGIPDEWETANGLNPNDKSDANLFTLDPKGWYSNIEVYINSLVEHIIKAQNADAISAVDEYFPSFTSTGITAPTVNSDVAKIEYFTLDGRKVSEPATGVNIRKITYSNGKVTADKVIKN